MSNKPIPIDADYSQPHAFEQKDETLCFTNSLSTEIRVMVTIVSTKGTGLKRVTATADSGEPRTLFDVGESAHFYLAKKDSQLTLVHQLCSRTKVQVQSSLPPSSTTSS